MKRLSGGPIALGLALVMNPKKPFLSSLLRGQSFALLYADDTVLISIDII